MPAALDLIYQLYQLAKKEGQEEAMLPLAQQLVQVLSPAKATTQNDQRRWPGSVAVMMPAPRENNARPAKSKEIIEEEVPDSEPAPVAVEMPVEPAVEETASNVDFAKPERELEFTSEAAVNAVENPANETDPDTFVEVKKEAATEHVDTPVSQQETTELTDSVSDEEVETSAPQPEPLYEDGGSENTGVDGNAFTAPVPAEERKFLTLDNEEPSLNDKLRNQQTELGQTLESGPIKDIRKAININDRYRFINELFRGDETMYDRSLKRIQSCEAYPEAQFWIQRELKVKMGWDDRNELVRHFESLVRRRFL